MNKSFRIDNFFQNDRIDTTNAFLDKSRPKEEAKIAPKSIELTDYEQSSVY